MIIEEVMNSLVAGLSPDDNLSAAIALMRERRSSCVVICDAGKPVGIVTERDAVRFLDEVIKVGEYKEVALNTIMTPNPICVDKASSLYDGLLLARKNTLRHLLVTDEAGLLVGLVTQTDLVMAYMNLVDRQSELESENQLLQLISNQDALMKIGNRRAMEMDLDYTESTANRYGKAYSIALLDVDYFKNYNDHYGHQAGDIALQSLANIIQQTMRNTDRVYRFGGEELLMLMPETQSDTALVAAERVRQAVVDLKIPHEKSPFSAITISIGIASGFKEPWSDLVVKADQALYQAKNDGRNHVCEYQRDVAVSAQSLGL